MDNQPVFFRPGGKGRRGFLVNILVAGPMGQALREGKGFLCITRGRCYLIPFGVLRRWLRPKFSRVMIDISLDMATESMVTARLDPLPVAKFGGQ